MTITIRKNVERYDDICRVMPVEFGVTGLTMQQADYVAKCLTNHEAGCDYAFYAVGGDGDE